MMNTVQPIRDKKTIERMKKNLRANSTTRDYCFFVLGINSGLRVSDLLHLQVKDVVNEAGKLKERITINEQKTGKTKDFPISDAASKALTEHLKTLKDVTPDSFIFQSRQGNTALSRVQAWRVLNEAAKASGIKANEDGERVGTHTMRKTFGYHAYKMGMDISVIQKLLNHSSPAITLAYIGITRDDLDEVYLNLNL